MATDIVNLLIGGASHVGKSTFAACLGRATSWNVLSTDNMSRHPGRPWPSVPGHVAEFYTALSGQSIYQFLLNHHENMWPHIQGLLSRNVEPGSSCIWEGSALRPEYLTLLPSPQNHCLCLYAGSEFLRARIYRESDYHERDRDQRLMIDKFINRTIAENDATVEAAIKHGVDRVDVSKEEELEAAQQRLIAQLTGQQKR